jgi:hypothetical protein
MIVYDLNIIFIHIPKTGGTSIGNILHPDIKIINSNHSYKDYTESNGVQHHAEHLTYMDYKNILANKNLNISDYFIFSFVRNPYSRIVSLWKYWSKRKSNAIKLLPKNNKLLNFLKSSGSSIKEFENFVYHLHSQKNKIFLFGNLQNNFVKPDQVNFLGKFENIEQDIKTLLELVSVHANIDITKKNIQHLNRTSNTNTEYLNFISSTATRDQIYEIYESDFTIFDYKY